MVDPYFSPVRIMSQPASTRPVAGAAVAAANIGIASSSSAPPDADSDAHLYSQYAYSPPTSPRRQPAPVTPPPPPPTAPVSSRKPDRQQPDVAAQSHDWQQDHILPQQQSLPELDAVGRRSPLLVKPITVPSTRSVLHSHARAHHNPGAPPPVHHLVSVVISGYTASRILLPSPFRPPCCTTSSWFVDLHTLPPTLTLVSLSPSLRVRFRRSGLWPASCHARPTHTTSAASPNFSTCCFARPFHLLTSRHLQIVATCCTQSPLLEPAVRYANRLRPDPAALRRHAAQVGSPQQPRSADDVLLGFLQVLEPREGNYHVRTILYNHLYPGRTISLRCLLQLDNTFMLRD